MTSLLASRCRMVISREDPDAEAPAVWTVRSNRLILRDIGFALPVVVRANALGPTLRLGAALVQRAAKGAAPEIAAKQAFRVWERRPPEIARGARPWALIHGGRELIAAYGETEIGRGLDSAQTAIMRTALDKVEWAAAGKPVTQTVLYEAGRRMRDGKIRYQIAEEAQTALSAKPKGDDLRLGILDRRPGGAGQWLAAFRDVETGDGLQAALGVAAALFEASAEAFALATLMRQEEDGGGERDTAVATAKRRLVRLQNDIDACLDAYPVHFAPATPNVASVLKSAALRDKALRTFSEP